MAKKRGWSRLQLLRKSCVWLVSLLAAGQGFSPEVRAEGAVPELFCAIGENGQGLGCKYKDKHGTSRVFGDDDIGSFIERALSGGYITVKSKRGFERTYEVDPSAIEFKKLKEARKTATASEVAKLKLDIFSEIEKKSIQISDGLDTVFIQSDLLKYDPAIATDKCKLDMKVNATGSAYEKSIETLQAENKALAVFLSSLIKAFKDPSSCMGDFKLEVSSDGSVDLSQLQGLSQAFRTRCKRKS
jgi:hypothetical protein